MHACRLSALGYVLEQYSPEHRAADEEELRVGSVIGAAIGEQLPWLDRAATFAIGGSLSFATTPAPRTTLPHLEVRRGLKPSRIPAAGAFRWGAYAACGAEGADGERKQSRSTRLGCAIPTCMYLHVHATCIRCAFQ